jgi:reactive chlorine resistance protein C
MASERDHRAVGYIIGSDFIGLTEMIAALLIITGYLLPKAGIVGGLITSVMFFVTSTMVITTPGAITHVNAMGHMSFLSLFVQRCHIPRGIRLPDHLFRPKSHPF